METRSPALWLALAATGTGCSFQLYMEATGLSERNYSEVSGRSAA